MPSEVAFKKLSRNDTGRAPGHQGGIVIPQEIEEFFPDVSGIISPTSPTADVLINVEMIVRGDVVGHSVTRYQHQTWGAMRSPERRLTGGLGPLRNVAEADDIVLFVREEPDPRRIRLVLIKQNDFEYEQTNAMLGFRRWGIINNTEVIKNSDIRNEYQEIKEKLSRDFVVFDEKRKISESNIKRRVRDRAFRKAVLEMYGAICVITGEVIIDGASVNLDAAHIVPVENNGVDDPRNGIPMSKDMHWAFDRFLFSITDDYKVHVKRTVLESELDNTIKKLHGVDLKFTTDFRPHPAALDWRRRNQLFVL